MNSRPGDPQPEPVCKLSGYVGPASQPGLVRLYTALDDLSHYLEFDSSAVVQTMDTPDHEMSDGARSLFVRASTHIRWIREFPTAQHLFSHVKSTSQGSTGSSAAGS
jgi:hypothetical protein